MNLSTRSQNRGCGRKGFDRKAVRKKNRVEKDKEKESKNVYLDL